MSNILKPMKPKKSEALWLMSFSDMSLVLLCFFILLISTMSPNKEKFKNLKDGMTVQTEHPNQNLVSSDLAELTSLIQDIIKTQDLKDILAVTHHPGGVQIEFLDGMIFEPGEAMLNPQTLAMVDDVMSILIRHPKALNVIIEGHTDDLPVGLTSPFPSNWQLSAARGFALLDIFERQGVPPYRLHVEAFGEARPKIPTQGLEGENLRKARATNRRVVIRLE